MELPLEGRVVDRIVVQIEVDVWEVVLRLMRDHAHHVCIECNGRAEAEHVGGLPEDWPGDAFPSEVHAAVAQLREHLSWS